MQRDELCPDGKVFAEDEKYMLSKYETSDQELYLQIWYEAFEKSPVFNDESFKQKSWDAVLLDKKNLQLKILNKLTQEYLGEVILMRLNATTPELGIQLLRRYHSRGIGSRVMNLFVDKLKAVLQVEAFLVRILSDNHISQRMFEKMGAIKTGEEGKEYAELMNRMLQEMGREKFESIIGEDFDKTQRYTICYKLECNYQNK